MRRVGGARRGLDLWLIQRSSALYMALFAPVFLVCVVAAVPLNFQTWTGLFQPLAMKVGFLLFVASMLAHAWIGLREVCIDYVHVLLLRLGLYFIFAALYAGCLVWAFSILWGMK
jgi:succinate dehydrogenase / fumarate reductase membrane anchor subunit